MRGGRKEDEAKRFFRMLTGEGRGDRAAEGMGDDDCVADSQPVHQRGNGIRLLRQRLIASALRPAEPRAVQEQHFGATLEQGPQRQHLVLEIGAGAMDEDDRRQLGAGGRRDMDIMDARAIDLGERAGRRAASLDQPDAGAGDAGEGKEESNEEEEGGADEVHAEGYGGRAESV